MLSSGSPSNFIGIPRVKMGSGEFGPFTKRPSGIFGEFGLLVGEFGPQLENSAN